MKEITDTEFALIKRSVGGLNYNRVGQALDADGRFKAAVLGANADALNALVERIEPHDAPPPPPDVGPIDLGKLGIGATPWTMIEPGQVAFFEATADGQVSCSAQASFYCWGNVSASAPGTFPDDPAVTAAASATAPRLVIKAGQFYTMKHDAPTRISMHASIEG